MGLTTYLIGKEQSICNGLGMPFSASCLKNDITNAEVVLLRVSAGKLPFLSFRTVAFPPHRKSFLTKESKERKNKN